MCGIVGIFGQADELTVAKMARSVAHRGPDKLDWLAVGNHSLGASRLIILGNPSASAIYFNRAMNLACMLNGEIYNLRSLRYELVSLGYACQTDLESEVLALLYRHYGLDFVAKLKGMFAIAILDNDRLILARDKFGIKPLYFNEMGNRILFGSEIKAILAHPEFRPKINESALDEISVFGYVHSMDGTPFEGIYQVEPGTVIEFTSGTKIITKYWKTPKATYFDADQHIDYSIAVKELRQNIIASVDTILSHGNHPLGIYLSGGLDSTILTLVARNILNYPVQTFTMADTSETGDLLAARKVARTLGTKHIERRVTIEDYFAALDHFVWHYESIVAGGVFDIHGGVAFHLLSKTVSDHVKVALSGEGADELFGGYYWIYTHPLGFADLIKNRLNNLNLPQDSPLQLQVDDLFPLPENESAYKRNLFNDLVHAGLANYHLQSVDRSAGAFGFEVRPAYLYDDLAEFALSLPIEYKVPNKHSTKRILKDAFKPELEQLGLDWVSTRLKEGMPAAVSSIAPLVDERIESLVHDSLFIRHPMKRYFKNKMDLYLYDLFAKAFSLENEYALQDCVPR